MIHYPKIAQLKTIDRFRERCQELGISIPIQASQDSAQSTDPMADPWSMGKLRVGNRWCIHPMEGWDANPDGTASELALRRWQRFGQSGAKLIWGGEAAAVRADGRANPRQTMATKEHVSSLTLLRQTLVDAHIVAGMSADDLVVGLQLTHSGRFSRPNSKNWEPRIAYRHPLLDRKFGLVPDNQSMVWTDMQLEELIGDYVQAAKSAFEAGFNFVDVKACHGYLLHEFLSARSRPGIYGGDLEGRTRLIRTIISNIQRETPELHIGVRLSLFDRPPYEVGPEVGQPMNFDDLLPYTFGFGNDPNNPLEIDLSEPIAFLKSLQDIGVSAINLTCGSPYYNPHIQRPAIFPPSDGYLPPEDPLVGVARQINAAAECKRAVPGLPMIGSGYTYLQDFLPQVASEVVRQGMIDAVGLGRMVLSYPTLPQDSLNQNAFQRKQVCRTFSDCTTAPRKGLVSGCYPLDEHYKKMPEAGFLKSL